MVIVYVSNAHEPEDRVFGRYATLIKALTAVLLAYTPKDDEEFPKIESMYHDNIVIRLNEDERLSFWFQAT